MLLLLSSSSFFSSNSIISTLPEARFGTFPPSDKDSALPGWFSILKKGKEQEQGFTSKARRQRVSHNFQCRGPLLLTPGCPEHMKASRVLPGQSQGRMGSAIHLQVPLRKLKFKTRWWSLTQLIPSLHGVGGLIIMKS